MIAFAASVVSMFGVSALFHRRSWTPRAARRIGQLDHAMIYALIAGTYAPVGLLVTRPRLARADPRRPPGAGRCSRPQRSSPGRARRPGSRRSICIALGSIAIVVLPQIVASDRRRRHVLLIGGGGLAYVIGAVVYARRRPDPMPDTFGYHELFHALVIVAVACQYAAVAFFVVPQA